MWLKKSHTNMVRRQKENSCLSPTGMWHFMIRKKALITPTGPKLHKQFFIFFGDTSKMEIFDHLPSETRAVIRGPIVWAVDLFNKNLIVEWLGISQHTAPCKKHMLFFLVYPFIPMALRTLEGVYLLSTLGATQKNPSLQAAFSPRPGGAVEVIKNA